MNRNLVEKAYEYANLRILLCKNGPRYAVLLKEAMEEETVDRAKVLKVYSADILNVTRQDELFKEYTGLSEEEFTEIRDVVEGGDITKVSDLRLREAITAYKDAYLKHYTQEINDLYLRAAAFLKELPVEPEPAPEDLQEPEPELDLEEIRVRLEEIRKDFEKEPTEVSLLQEVRTFFKQLF